MLDDTLLLTVNGLMIVIMTSGAHYHTSIHIQSYTYKHAHTSIHIQSCNDVAHGYMKQCYEKLYLSLVSAPASVQFSGLIVGSLVSAPATGAVYENDG